MTPGDPYVIVGAGMAGAAAVRTLREQGFDGPLVLLGEELEPPYDRAPLSKGYLQAGSRESIEIHPTSWYADHGVDLQLGTAVTHLDPAANRIGLADGTAIRFAKLLLTTGAAPRRLAAPGADLDGVLYLRQVSDGDLVRGALRPGAGRVVVVGAGWIGLEVAAAARAAGAEVTLLERADFPLQHVLGPETARVFAELHHEHGVDLRCGVTVEAVTGANGRCTGVRLADGTHIDADTVVVGIGAVPNDQLARAAGLATHDGIRVDADLGTSHPDIYAAGDVANAWHPRLGAYVRVEHCANAMYQPRAAARAMLGEDVAYDEVPYCCTDQFDVAMQYTGHLGPRGYHHVLVRGDLRRREFVAFWVRDERVVAAMSVNVHGVTPALQALVGSRRPVDRARLTDPAVPLTALVPVV